MARQIAFVAFLIVIAVYWAITSLGASGSFAHAINAFFSIPLAASIGWMMRDNDGDS